MTLDEILNGIEPGEADRLRAALASEADSADCKRGFESIVHDCSHWISYPNAAETLRTLSCAEKRFDRLMRKIIEGMQRRIFDLQEELRGK